MPAKFQYLEEFQCFPPLHSSGIGKKQSKKKNYQQPGNACQQTCFCVDGSQQIVWHQLSTPQLELGNQNASWC